MQNPKEKADSSRTQRKIQPRYATPNRLHRMGEKIEVNKVPNDRLDSLIRRVIKDLEKILEHIPKPL